MPYTTFGYNSDIAQQDSPAIIDLTSGLRRAQDGTHEFWEVGASGNVYTKQAVIETLLERYNDPNYQDIWEAKDFALTQIAAGNYLLTYVLIQNKTRMTRRSTIWRGMNGSWKILYHQGTIIKELNHV